MPGVGLVLEREVDGRVLPREESGVALDLAEAHMSVSVRGDLDGLLRDNEGLVS